MPIEKTTALVADDHEIFRLGLAALLRNECGFQRIIETGSLDEAVQVLGENESVTFATFDLGMPGMSGAYNLHSVRQCFPDIGVAIVSASERREDMLAAVAAGVHGYIPKTLGMTQIASALNAVLGNTIYLPWSIARLPAPSEERVELEPTVAPQVKLTARQNEVLHLIRLGRSNKEIARALSLTESTVKVHANALYRALGVRNRVSAASSHHS